MVLFLIIATLILVVSMFAYRILFREGRRYDQHFRTVQIFLGLVIILSHGSLMFGFLNTLVFLFIGTMIGSIVEILGVTKGWVFGKYRYTPTAGPKLFGILPAFAPLMWGVLSYLGYWMTDLLTERFLGDGFHDKIIFVLAASGIVLLIDIVAEPIAVDEGRWVWENHGRYYGIPFSNFLGWYATAFSIFSLFSFFIKPVRNPDISRWIAYLPAFGYWMFMAICARVCFERKLKLAGMIGIGASVAFLFGGALVYWFRIIP